MSDAPRPVPDIHPGDVIALTRLSMPDLRAWADAQVATYRERSAAEGYPWTCRGAGCGGCCCGEVAATPEEAAELCRAATDREVARAFVWRDRAGWRTVACPLRDPAAWTCGHYAIRPLVCRVYHVVTPPEWCDPSWAGDRKVGSVGEVLALAGAATLFRGPPDAPHLQEVLAAEGARRLRNEDPTGPVHAWARWERWLREYGDAHDIGPDCDAATAALVARFPELRRVRGHVTMLMAPDGDERPWPHWWCVTPDGAVVDPTRGQFPGPLRYEPWDEARGEPTGKCPNCGGLCTDGRYLCSDVCEAEFRAYLEDECRR